MILYCIVCYFIMLGMIVEDESNNGRYSKAWIAFIFAPVFIPMFIGMYLEQRSKK
jgi:uncharacterized membrane protein YadS